MERYTEAEARAIIEEYTSRNDGYLDRDLDALAECGEVDYETAIGGYTYAAICKEHKDDEEGTLAEALFAWFLDHYEANESDEEEPGVSEADPTTKAKEEATEGQKAGSPVVATMDNGTIGAALLEAAKARATERQARVLAIQEWASAMSEDTKTALLVLLADAAIENAERANAGLWDLGFDDAELAERREPLEAAIEASIDGKATIDQWCLLLDEGELC